MDMSVHLKEKGLCLKYIVFFQMSILRDTPQMKTSEFSL